MLVIIIAIVGALPRRAGRTQVGAVVTVALWPSISTSWRLLRAAVIKPDVQPTMNMNTNNTASRTMPINGLAISQAWKLLTLLVVVTGGVGALGVGAEFFG